MSLQIYVAHSGKRLLADPISFASPDALRSWIVNQAAIPTDRQILITGRGKNVRTQNLLTETEVFVYDKLYISPTSRENPPETPSPFSVDLREAPTTLANQTSLQAWRDLFKARRSWAVELTELLVPYRDLIRQNLEATEIIQRASFLALDNLQSHVRNLQSKLDDTRVWARGATEDHENILRDWRSNLQILSSIHAKDGFAFLLQRPRTPTKKKKKVPSPSDYPAEGSLAAFVNEKDVESAASELRIAATEFKQRLEDLEVVMGNLSADTRQIEAEIRSGTDDSNLEYVNGLYADVATLTRKISTDYEDLLRLPDSPTSVPTASRRALIHTRDLLPSLKNLSAEISQHAQQAVTRRNSCLASSTRALQTISAIQSGLADFQSQINGLGLNQEGIEAYDVVHFVFDLPIAYGSILIESVRRSEWAEKVKTNAEHATEDMKTRKEDEMRRRKKWKLEMGRLINSTTDNLGLGIEVGLVNTDEAWPMTGRRDVIEYVESLKALQIEDAVQQVTHLLKMLEAPATKSKESRVFKNGSVFDADLAIGRSSMLVGDEVDPTRSLRDENLRLEERLKASDSRVRKLEDLLHRQSQMSRPTSVNFGPAPLELDRPPSSPVGQPSPRPGEVMSRRSSGSSRRLSSNQNPEDKVLIQRIVSLEADLRTGRDAVIKLQRESHEDRQALAANRERMNAAESTKKDLLANLEAQRQEFDDERQLLEDGIHKLKIRLEEVEDELDRVLGSRDHQKMTWDKTVVGLQSDIDRLRKDSSEEIAKAQEQNGLLQGDLASQRSRADALQRQLQQSKEEGSSLQNQNLILAGQLRDQADAQIELVSSLQVAHSHLSPAGSAPGEISRLASAIEILSEGMAIHARTAEENAQLASAEAKSLEEQVAHVKSQLGQAKDRLMNEETEIFTLREALALESGKLASSRHELDDAQTELSNLRAKFAAGETGSEALKERVAEEEHRVAELTEKLAIAESNTQTAAQENMIWKDKVQAALAESKQWKDRLDVRGVRAKDLSQRLLSHNDRTVRMLEQMGYSIVRQDDRLVIHRASKVSASTVLVGEGSTSLNRSVGCQPPTQHYNNVSDLDTLYWMSDADAVSEDSRFQSFISTLARLDIEAATEMIVKRYKDVELLARKYQKDSRAYREKTHRVQSEAHDKIAYRSFKEGDLALFLPTRNQATKPWAAFNVGAPHYFLREQDIHKLQARDWLLARISKVEERVVDLSRSLTNGQHVRNPPMGVDPHSINTEASDHGSLRSMEDENPFELSDGLRWYLIDAAEEKPGTAPVLTPGQGKSTVAATNVDVKGSIRLTKEGKRVRDSSINGSAAMATKTLSKSLDSRRSSSGSKKGPTMIPSLSPNLGAGNESAVADSSRPTSSSAHQGGPSQSRFQPLITADPAEQDSKPDQPAREDAPIFEAKAQRGVNTEVTDGLQQQPTTTSPHRSSRQQLPPSAPGASASPKKEERPPPRHGQVQPSPQKKGWDRLWSIDYTFDSDSR